MKELAPFVFHDKFADDTNTITAPTPTHTALSKATFGVHTRLKTG